MPHDARLMRRMHAPALACRVCGGEGLPKGGFGWVSGFTAVGLRPLAIMACQFAPAARSLGGPFCKETKLESSDVTEMRTLNWRRLAMLAERLLAPGRLAGSCWLLAGWLLVGYEIGYDTTL